MRVLLGLSGGVDSSVAAARLLADGYDVVGATMKLWGGESDSGCCSVADVEDARRAADRLGVEHHVFAFSDEFGRDVVEPYVADHAAGRTPNPCIECNRHLKFDRFLRRARALGFDAVATGHHARVVVRPDGTRRVARGADAAKDQSYVLYPLGQDALAATLFPIGMLTKAEVRAEAARLGLSTAGKPDSQEVCFIHTGRGGRRAFLAERLGRTPATVVEHGTGRPLGSVDALELVTVGQRRGLGVEGGPAPQYVTDVDVAAQVVTIGTAADLLSAAIVLERVVWTHQPVAGSLLVQCSAHGRAVPATVELDPVTVVWERPQRRVAPGQSVVLYDGDEVVGGGIAVRTRR